MCLWPLELGGWGSSDSCVGFARALFRHCLGFCPARLGVLMLGRIGFKLLLHACFFCVEPTNQPTDQPQDKHTTNDKHTPIANH